MPLEGARAGAPDAIQVADRWHLWHNLAEYAEKTVAAHRGCLKDQPGGGDADGISAPGTADTLEQEPPEQGERAIMPDGSLDACGRERRLVRRTRERYAEIHRRLDAGESLSGISRATGLDRKTVQRFARAGSIGELLGKATSRNRSWIRSCRTCASGGTNGVTDAAVLHAELRERGWASPPGDIGMLAVIARSFLTGRRGELPESSGKCGGGICGAGCRWAEKEPGRLHRSVLFAVAVLAGGPVRTPRPTMPRVRACSWLWGPSVRRPVRSPARMAAASITNTAITAPDRNAAITSVAVVQVINLHRFRHLI